MRANGKDQSKTMRCRTILVGGASKDAGKSTVSSMLISSLGLEYAMKISSGGEHNPDQIVTDRAVLMTPGTDTWKYARAGATGVLWVDATPDQLPGAIPRAMAMFPAGEAVLVEGNSAFPLLDSCFSLFIVNLPIALFKPSALSAIERSDLVLIRRTPQVVSSGEKAVIQEARSRNRAAEIVVVDDGLPAMKEAIMLKSAVIMGRLRMHSPPDQP